MDDRRTHRGLRDEAGVGPDPNAAEHLTRLRDLNDYKVADGEPDIRGWNVFTASGREIGDVDDLLIDLSTDEVVLLDIDLKRDDRHALVPIRSAWIDRDHRRVVVSGEDFGSPELLERAAERTVQRTGEVVEHGATPPADTLRKRDPALRREVRYPAGLADEVVIEKRPVVMEEVVVRRRVVDPDELDASERERLRETTRDTLDNRPPTEERR